MDKTGQRLILAAFALAGALLASALMLMFTPNHSWLAFVGWVIFFLALQSPLFLASRASQESCTAWLSRLRRRG